MRKRSTNTYAVILVGGKGKRLRPLSSDARPKPFLSITKDGKSLFEKTLERARQYFPLKRIIVVANSRHERMIRDSAPFLHRNNLILEPETKNTAPAIALAASALTKKSKDAVMAVMWADHYIPLPSNYLKTLKAGIGFIKIKRDAIVTIAVKPNYASTELGYVKTSARTKYAANLPRGMFKIEHFTEKPSLRKAKIFAKRKRYFWNTGSFIFRAETILDAIRSYTPRITTCLERGGAIGKIFKAMPNISIDYAVMEKFPNSYCVVGDFEWHDVGTFESLEKVLRLESRDFIEKGGKIVKIL